MSGTDKTGADGSARKRRTGVATSVDETGQVMADRTADDAADYDRTIVVAIAVVVSVAAMAAVGYDITHTL